MNSENIITIIGLSIFTVWMIALCVIALWEADQFEIKNRQTIKRGRELRNAELRGQGRLLMASNSVTKGA